MDFPALVRARRSIKRFTDAPVPRERLAELLELATLGPNFRMTQPWRFLALGPEGRRAYGAALGARKAKRITDPELAAATLRKSEEEAVAVPAMLGVVQQLHESAETRADDTAAIWMGIENLLLGAVALGLGTHLRTGAVLDDEALRAPLGVGEGERLVALIQLGLAAEVPEAKPRATAAARTTWLG